MGRRGGDDAGLLRDGCILRARLLEDVRRVLARDPELPLLLAFDLREILVACAPAWRRVVAAAARAGLAVPGLAAGLAWLDTVSTARGSGALIQAQRSQFGGQRYQCIDEPPRTED